MASHPRGPKSEATISCSLELKEAIMKEYGGYPRNQHDALQAMKDDAEYSRELYTTLKLVYVLATSGVGPEDERWKTVIKRAEDVLFPKDEEAEHG